ncbi:MAG: aminomethyltransferase beta-barrel domain-containing protein, partial [Candidatus Paceibacterota bacterium]
EKGVTVTFAEPQQAVSPGQSLVLYKDQECIGGGIIEKTVPKATFQKPFEALQSNV